MNAYELADYVADNGYIGTDTTHEVANMLRQQADRIAKLEHEISFKSWLQTKPLSDEEIYSLLDKCIEYTDDHDHAEFMYKKFARAIEERHGIK